MSNRFTQKAEKSLNNSAKIAEKLGHTYIGTEHILLALTEDESSCAAIILKKSGVGKELLEKTVRDYSGTGIRSTLTSKDLTPRARSILENSYNYAMKYGNGVIGTEHILMSLLDENNSVAIKMLKNLRVDLPTIRDETHAILRNREKAVQKTKKEPHPTVLKQYGKNLCQMAREGAFDPVVGRDKETERVIRILCRKNKNNPCLIGEAGVGKTAIIEGLAQRIADGSVPEILREKTIISLDLTSMVAGAKYRGDFEERIKNIINEAAKSKDVILFIDEIHTIVGAGAAEGAIDASNILKPQLARGDIQLIGATTFREYHKYIERDSALERRFQPIMIEEPDEKTTIQMLSALKEHYEAHHKVRIDQEAISECVTLSSKYISDRYLPDKAIDVLDEACVMASANNAESDNTEYNLEQYSLFDEDNNTATEVDKSIFTNKSKPTVDVATVRSTISEMCHIPLDAVRKNIDYQSLEEALNSTLIGQDCAIRKLISALKRWDMDFCNPERPRGIFMFLGESGVGKTALALELSKHLFYSNNGLIRIDMSEYSEKQSISKLIGSPPGYVGHEEGGKLTEAVRRRPYSVVLFDEIEKADKEVLNILLQIADYGYLTDSLGRHINFRNTVIIMTTNIGAAARGSGRLGFLDYPDSDTEIKIQDLLKKYYTDEFINRFDEIIFFKSLGISDLIRIATDRIEVLKKKISKKGYDFNCTHELIKHLAEASFKKGLGARPLLREISARIEAPLIELLMKLPSLETAITVGLINDKIVFETSDAENKKTHSLECI